MNFYDIFFAMGNMFNKISEKYINQLGQKQVFKTVKLSIAESTVKQAVEEAASVAKKSIEDAVAPLKAKIAQKDEFLTKSTNENQSLKTKAKHFEEIATSAQNKLNKYKSIVQEAYKIGLTPEIRNQKAGIAHILSSLIKHKQPKETKAEKVLIKESQTSLVKQAKEPVKTEQTVALLQQKTESQKPIKRRTYQAQSTQVSPEVLAKIANERTKQVLDKDRMTLASQLIRNLIASTQSYDFKGISEQYKKASKRDFSDILRNTGVKLSHDYEGLYNDIGDFIKFRDNNGKELLLVDFNYKDYQYHIRISDKNGLPMVTTKVENGITKEMRVYFNDVKKIADPEILYDKSINNYAQNIITEAKKGTIAKTRNSTYAKHINYYTPDGVEVVSEKYPIKAKDQSIPLHTYIASPITGEPEKCFSSKSSVMEKYGKKGTPPKIYTIEGFDHFEKFKKDKTTFEIDYLVSSENTRFGVQTLYDKNSGDKDSRWQKMLYEKTNYGLAAHPLTQSFSYFDLTKHNIKPWDFSILNHYIK